MRWGGLLWATFVASALACGGAGNNGLLTAGDAGGGSSGGGSGSGGSSGGGSGGMGDGGGSGSSSGAPGGDGGGSDGAACASYCAMQQGNATFCSDFDCEQSPADWSHLGQSLGMVSLTQKRAVSPPNALDTSLQAVANPPLGGYGADASKDLPGTWQQVDLELDVWVPSFPGGSVLNSNISLLMVRPTNEPGGGAGLVYSGDGYFFLSSPCLPTCSVRAGLDPAPLAEAWNHMHLQFAFGSAQTVTLSYEGVDHQQHTVSGMGDTAKTTPAMGATLEVGLWANAKDGTTNQPFTAYFDNVALRLQ